MAITPTYAHVEMSDGTKHSVRLLLADRMRMEGTAKRMKWDLEDDQITVNTFTAWAALKRAGHYTDTFEKFAGGDCIDLYVDQTAPADEPDEDDPLNPTEPATQSI